MSSARLFPRSSLPLLLVVLLLLVQAARGFWVAPVWGNKVDAEEDTANSNPAQHLGNDKVEGKTQKYPSWVFGNQGLPFIAPEGKRSKDMNSVYTAVLDCVRDARTCSKLKHLLKTL